MNADQSTLTECQILTEGSIFAEDFLGLEEMNLYQSMLWQSAKS